MASLFNNSEQKGPCCSLSPPFWISGPQPHSHPPLKRQKCFVILGGMFSSLPPDLGATASQLLKVIALATWSFRAGKPCWLFLRIGLNNLTREAAGCGSAVLATCGERSESDLRLASPWAFWVIDSPSSLSQGILLCRTFHRPSRRAGLAPWWGHRKNLTGWHKGRRHWHRRSCQSQGPGPERQRVREREVVRGEMLSSSFLPRTSPTEGHEPGALAFNLSDSVLIWVQALGCVGGGVRERSAVAYSFRPFLFIITGSSRLFGEVSGSIPPPSLSFFIEAANPPPGGVRSGPTHISHKTHRHTSALAWPGPTAGSRSAHRTSGFCNCKL